MIVAHEHLAQLPMAVRRALNGKKLREELEEARRALRHSQSLYRALADNPTYGIYRCDAEGELLDANQALAEMLGYSSKIELLAANQESEIIPNFRDGPRFTGFISETKGIEPVEMEWKRKNGTTLKIRLSGCGVYDDHANGLAREAAFPKEVTRSQNRHNGLFASLIHHSKLHAAFLNVHDILCDVALREDGLFSSELANLSAETGRVEKQFHIERRAG